MARNIDRVCKMQIWVKKLILYSAAATLLLLIMSASNRTTASPTEKTPDDNKEKAFMRKASEPNSEEMKVKQDQWSSNELKSYQEFVDRKFSSPANEAAESDRIEEALRLREKAVSAWEKYPDGPAKYKLLADQLFALMKLQFQVSEGGAGHRTFRRLGEMCRSGQIDTKSMVYRLSTEGASFANHGNGFLAEQFFRSRLESANTTDARYYYRFEIARTLREQNEINDAKKIYADVIAQAMNERDAKQITLARMSLAEIYKKEGNLQALQEVRQLLDKSQCPLCGSKQEIIPVTYGLIMPTEDVRAAADVTVHYGGCCDEPFRRYCKNCKQVF